MENLGVRLQTVPSYAKQIIAAGDAKISDIQSGEKKSKPSYSIYLKGINSETPEENESEKLKKFHNFANQMLAVSLRNAKTGKSKTGEITDKEGLGLYRTYIKLFGHKNHHGVQVIGNNRDVYNAFDMACDEKSASSTNISLDEQEEILRALAYDQGIGMDEVVKALNNRDEQLAKAGQKINLNA